MTTKNTGGSAFGEMRQIGDVKIVASGMMIRDEFALGALALGGEFFHCIDDHQNDPPDEIKHVAFIAYAIADAMIKEREK